MKISLKLLVDNNSHKVLFAEAEKKFVDFLFGLLHIPIGSIIGNGFLTKKSKAGSFAKIYNSIDVLRTTHLQPNFFNSEDSILKPISFSKHCKFAIHEQGYVKGKVLYMVLDDLTVKPMSVLSGIRLVNELKIEDVDSLEEVFVVVGIKQCIELLRNSFISNTVLTNVLYESKNGGKEQCDDQDDDEDEDDEDEDEDGSEILTDL